MHPCICTSHHMTIMIPNNVLCSMVRGPATAPFLVTWPTSRMGIPVDLANRSNNATHSRICVTPPAAELPPAWHTMVWIESTTSNDGGGGGRFLAWYNNRVWLKCACASRQVTICSAKASTWVSDTKYKASLPNDKRWARVAICSAVSSPDTYQIECCSCCGELLLLLRVVPEDDEEEEAAMLATACNKSVDFPTPGVPPNKLMEPFMRPPPRTLVISASSGITMRCCCGCGPPPRRALPCSSKTWVMGMGGDMKWK